MNRIITLVALLCISVAASAQKYTWKAIPMDGSRAGCRYAMQDDVDEAIGTLNDGVYTAPNGNMFQDDSMVVKTAAIVLAAQPAMYEKKAVIGYSDHEIVEKKPESELSNMIVDLMMAAARNESGKEIHLGLLNFGGIRSDLPKGKILLDDVESMLPFNNNIVYMEMTGREIRKQIDYMLQTKLLATGGMKIVVKDKKAVRIKVNGKPLDDDKVYGVATITFLLRGGDDFNLGENALIINDLGILVRQPVLDHIINETKSGRMIGYKKDGRVIIR